MAAPSACAGCFTWAAYYEYVHRDHLGSVDAIANSAGVVQARFSFDPFGGRRSPTWNGDLDATGLAALLAWQDSRGSRGFTNHGHLNRTGFVHMNGRVYDPRIGRFVSPDPIVPVPSFSQSYNRYAYVHNNPLSYTDPTGLFLKKAWKGVKKAVKGVGRFLRKYGREIAAVVAFAYAPTLAFSEAGRLGLTMKFSKSRLVLGGVAAASRRGHRSRAGPGPQGPWSTPGIAGPVSGFGFAAEGGSVATNVPWWLHWVPMRSPGSRVQRRAVCEPRPVADGPPEWMFDLANVLPGPRLGGVSWVGIIGRALIVGVASETKQIRARIGWQPTVLEQDYELFVYLEYVMLDPKDTGATIGGSRPGIGPGEVQTRVDEIISARREDSRWHVFVYDVCILRGCWSNER